MPFPPSSSHGKGPSNNKGSKKGKKGSDKGSKLMTQAREGTDICYAWNNGECDLVCPRGFAHVCQMCLRGHRKIEHPQGAKGRY